MWSAERKTTKQSSTYRRNKRALNGLTEFSLFTNFDSLHFLLFITGDYHELQSHTYKRENAFNLMNRHSSMLLSRSIKLFA